MTRLRVLLSRVRALLTGRRRDAELNDEVTAHLEMLADDYVRRGWSPAAARDRARRDFGGLDQIKEAYRDQRGLPAIEHLLRDAQFGIRLLWRSPGFAAAAIVSLALGIGATCAIFTLVNASLLKELPRPGSSACGRHHRVRDGRAERCRPGTRRVAPGWPRSLLSAVPRAFSRAAIALRPGRIWWA